MHLDWPGNAVYDLDAPGRIVDLYRAVLIEAATPQDLYAYPDAAALWALLWLPRSAPEVMRAEVPRPGCNQPRHRDRLSGLAMEPRDERIAKIALAAGARYGLALAGGYAVFAHGIGNRPSGEVDLFTSWQRVRRLARGETILHHAFMHDA